MHHLHCLHNSGVTWPGHLHCSGILPACYCAILHPQTNFTLQLCYAAVARNVLQVADRLLRNKAGRLGSLLPASCLFLSGRSNPVLLYCHKPSEPCSAPIRISVRKSVSIKQLNTAHTIKMWCYVLETFRHKVVPKRLQGQSVRILIVLLDTEKEGTTTSRKVGTTLLVT